MGISHKGEGLIVHEGVVPTKLPNTARSGRIVAGNLSRGCTTPIEGSERGSVFVLVCIRWKSIRSVC